MGINVHQREEKSCVAFIWGRQDYRSQRHTGKKKETEEVKKRGGQSEIIIITEVIFQGQYLRFSSTPFTSLQRCLQPNSCLPPLFSPVAQLFPVTHPAEEEEVSLPLGYWLKWAKAIGNHCCVAFQTGGIKWQKTNKTKKQGSHLSVREEQTTSCSPTSPAWEEKQLPVTQRVRSLCYDRL